MHKLVLLRHGESVWNKENLYTGWTDVDLSEKGLQEAHEAGKLLREGGYVFDIAYTSVLKRAIRTLWITLDEMDLMWIPVINTWRLNERHYGALQGLNKAQTAEQFGEKQVKIWRRSYDVPPPALTTEDPRWPGVDPRYRTGPRRRAADRVLEGHRGALPAVLAWDHRAGAQGGQAGRHRRAWQQLAGAGEISGQHLRRRDRRAEHPDRHPAGVRAG